MHIIISNITWQFAATKSKQWKGSPVSYCLLNVEHNIGKLLELSEGGETFNLKENPQTHLYNNSQRILRRL